MHRFLLLCLFVTAAIVLRAQEPFIYVSDAAGFQNGPWQILKYKTTGEFVSVFTTENLGWPQDILFLDDLDQVLISNLSTGRIDRYDAKTGAHAGVFANGISGPTRFDIGADSLLYVLQWSGSGTVLRYTLDGQYVDDFTSAGTPSSIGLDWDALGRLYVSSYNQDRVDRYDTNGQFIDTFIDSALVGPTNIWFGEDGVLNVLDYDGGDVKRFDAHGDYLETVITGLAQSEGFAFMEDGSLIIGNGGTGAVKQYDTAWNYVADLIPANTGGLIRPNAVVIHFETTVNDTTDTTITGTQQMVEEVIQVYPTSGRQFSMRATTQRVELVNVYALDGKLAYSGKPSDELLWDAQAASTGAYTIEMLLENGHHYRQKVLVE